MITILLTIVFLICVRIKFYWIKEILSLKKVKVISIGEIITTMNYVHACIVSHRIFRAVILAY